MAITYRVRDWDSLFETAETRKLDTLRWVPTPNKHDGLGFRRMTKHPRSVELFGAWNAIIQIASKARRGQRGSLVRDGEPLTAADLADMTGFPLDTFELALEYFSAHRNGWLETVGEKEIETPTIPPSAGQPGSNPGDAGSDPARPLLNGREGMEGKEGNVGSVVPTKSMARAGERRKGKHPLPTDFALTADREEYARSKGIAEPQEVFELFRLHHVKTGTAFVDWEAAWRTWVLNERKWGKTRRAGPAWEDPSDRVARVAAQMKQTRGEE